MHVLSDRWRMPQCARCVFHLGHPQWLLALRAYSSRVLPAPFTVAGSAAYARSRFSDFYSLTSAVCEGPIPTPVGKSPQVRAVVLRCNIDMQHDSSVAQRCTGLANACVAVDNWCGIALCVAPCQCACGRQSALGCLRLSRVQSLAEPSRLSSAPSLPLGSTEGHSGCMPQLPLSMAGAQLVEFVALCLQRDADARPCAARLSEHAFIRAVAPRVWPRVTALHCCRASASLAVPL